MALTQIPHSNQLHCITLNVAILTLRVYTVYTAQCPKSDDNIKLHDYSLFRFIFNSEMSSLNSSTSRQCQMARVQVKQFSNDISELKGHRVVDLVGVTL